MKREGAIGAAALIAILATVGISLQTGSKPTESSRPAEAIVKRPQPSTAKGKSREDKPGCGSLTDQLKDFLDIDEKYVRCPDANDQNSWKPSPELAEKTSDLKFVIALTPDPVHTHLSLLFDQFAVAIQEGAQDEKYDFDSSWFPWEDEQSSYPILEDEKKAYQEKQAKENQPGIILFRRAADCQNQDLENCKRELSGGYREGLVVFVVGEEATEGIHREQFRSAVRWIAALRPDTAAAKKVAILGPTFSGSIPSLVQLLSQENIKSMLSLSGANPKLAIYSGSVSSQNLAQSFQKAFRKSVVFHSFVQDDNEILRRFFDYMCHEQGPRAAGIAILSEDETAYGGRGAKESNNTCGNDELKPLRLYYPRDISALRGAYQTKLLFDTGSSSQTAELGRRNLPSDLADPTGRVHDSIRSYAGNQTALAQEAFLLEIVAELRDHQIIYILLRGSNALDQLFLTNFLRRSYPDGRIVIFSSDLSFIREHGANGLSGVMTLSTYPLIPHEPEWTQHQHAPAANRVFSADAVEGTYVAFRLLLNDKNFNAANSDATRCRVREEQQDQLFLPAVVCRESDDYSPIPDYSPPFWINQRSPADNQQSDAKPVDDGQTYYGPATWLSVIGVNRFWPVASLMHGRAQDRKEPDQKKGAAQVNKNNDLEGPETPLENEYIFPGTGGLLCLPCLVLLVRIVYGQTCVPGTLCHARRVAPHRAGVLWYLLHRVDGPRLWTGLRSIFPSQSPVKVSTICAVLHAHRSFCQLGGHPAEQVHPTAAGCRAGREVRELAQYNP
jgi:hypothetical protein